MSYYLTAIVLAGDATNPIPFLSHKERSYYLNQRTAPDKRGYPHDFPAPIVSVRINTGQHDDHGGDLPISYEERAYHLNQRAFSNKHGYPHDYLASNYTIDTDKPSHHDQNLPMSHGETVYGSPLSDISHHTEMGEE